MKLDTAALERLDPPRLHWLVSDPEDVGEFDQLLADRGITARVLRGSAMRTLDGLFAEVSSKLEFPDYFGNNWDALDECLADFEWLPGFAYTIVIVDALEVLAAEPAHQLEVLVKLLDRVSAEWAESVEIGEAWDRPAVPFHVIFQETASRVPDARARYASAGVSTADCLNC